jgi:hypothetical protein
VRRLLVAVVLLSSAACGTARAASAGGDWVVSNERAVPLQWFQGLTHARGGRERFFVGVFDGVTRTDTGLRQQLRTEDVIPPDVAAQYGFNHIGDPTFAHGELLLPLECFVPGAPNGGNPCGRGAVGVADA